MLSNGRLDQRNDEGRLFDRVGFLYVGIPENTQSICRWGNIGLGALYIAVMALTLPGAWNFYILLGAVEIAVGLLTVWLAWSWPRQGSTYAAGAS
jgi:hypothetical protein